MIRINRHRFGAIRTLLLVGLLAIGLGASTAGQAVASPPVKATFQGLGQMPGVVIQAGSCGTQALGISGDSSVIVGAGCVSSGNDEAFRWTVTGGYQRL